MFGSGFGIVATDNIGENLSRIPYKVKVVKMAEYVAVGVGLLQQINFAAHSEIGGIQQTETKLQALELPESMKSSL